MPIYFSQSDEISQKRCTFTDKIRIITYQDMRKGTILAALVAFGITASAQTTVTPYTPGVSTEGVAYYLPKTAINIHVTVEKTTYTPGELCQYAERYLRINGISNKEDIHYQIKEVVVEPVGIPDASKLYHIEFAANTVAPFIEIDNSGVLLAVNTHNPYTTVKEPTVASVVESTLSPRNFMTEEMLMTGSKAKMAELIAKEIYNIRESRNLTLRGQNENMPKDGEGLQIIIDNTKEQEEALMQLFVGTTTTECTTHTFQILPDSEADRLLFSRFSRKLGILHKDDLAGAPIYIDIKSRNTVPAMPIDSIATTSAKSKKLKIKKSNKLDGLVYNLPERANVKVYTNSTTLAEETISIAQFGNTETLSSTFFSKKKGIKVILDPTSGAIMKIEE